MRIPYIHTNDGISVVLFGRPYHAAKDDKYYDEVVALAEEAYTDEQELLDVFERSTKRLKEITNLTPDMLYSGGVVTYKGEVMHNYAADRLIGMIESGRDHAPLANFLDKLQSNPSKRVVDNLYSFLEKGAIPLTEDGDFLAYKAVRDNYRDIHSGQFDNSLGAVVEMPRNRVDEDPNRTCSAGLHVCSFSYLPHFSHADGHVMVCKVNPADVVAIPADYDDAKMRVSRYQVIDEVPDYYNKRRDVLGDIGRDTGVMEPKFTLRTDEDDLDSYYTIAEARLQAQEAANDFDTSVEIVDAEDFVIDTIFPQ